MKFIEMYPDYSSFLICVFLTCFVICVCLVSIYIVILLIFNIIGSIKSFKSEDYTLKDDDYKED